MADPTALPPRPGDVWRDLDRRGGPTLVIVEVDPPHIQPGRATVTDENGKRRRTVLLDRFRPHASYRRGYALVDRGGVPADGGVPRG